MKLVKSMMIVGLKIHILTVVSLSLEFIMKKILPQYYHVKVNSMLKITDLMTLRTLIPVIPVIGFVGHRHSPHLVKCLGLYLLVVVLKPEFGLNLI